MRAFALSSVVLALGVLAACSPSPQAGGGSVTTAAPAPPPVAAPAKVMKMVCRNSQDGRNVECGTPNAVMVGMKPE